jgi:uncharacterized protein
VVVPLYRASAERFRIQVLDGSLIPTVSEQYRHRLRRSPPPAEIRSWERSLTTLSADVNQAGLDGVEVLVEYQLPLTSKRADVVLCGAHPRTGLPSYVVIELKQWTHASMLDGTDDVCLLNGVAERTHPVEQVRRYCSHMLDFTAVFAEMEDPLAGAAYLHNATDHDVAELWDLPQSEHGRLFTGQRRGAFLDFLRSRLAPDGGVHAADLLIGSAVRPSRQLLAVAAEEVQQREVFTLLDEQQTAYSLVMRAVDRAHQANIKEVIIVTGGPGSGKSVIALSLMGELSRSGRTVLHATGSSALTNTMRRVAGAKAPRVREMFRFFNSFTDARPNELDVLICDEAHRIRETSSNRFTSRERRTGRPQIDELIDAARVPVFLLDEHQVVRPGEIGTVADIKAAADRHGLGVRRIDLDAQFRCGGSRAFETWVLRLLGLEPGGPIAWGEDEHFVLGVVDSPQELEYRLRCKHDEGYGARMAAGYCWPWSDPIPGGGLVDDVVIGGWRRPWNNKKATSHNGAPGTPFWASDPAGFEQVGCVYTAQGFEYDWAGVIIGPDLVRRGDRWVAQPHRSHDSRVKRAPIELFDRAVRNTYKVLMTRGMVGCLVMSTDPETHALLRSLMPASASGDTRQHV